MLIGIKSSGIDYKAQVIEPKVNHEASSYILNNYKDIVKIVRSYDIREEKANDLVHDVYISIYEAELNGDGFDMEYGSRINEDGGIDFNLMDVSQFVLGRMRLYAKNPKYRTDIIEASNCSVIETSVYTDTILDAQGQEIIDKNGMPKLVRRVERKKVAVQATATAASFNEGGDVVDNNDDFQKAFATASTADSTDDIAEMLSLREQIDFCIDICNLNGVNLVNILKNIDVLAEMLGDYSKKKKTAESVFSKLSELVTYHTELGQNLIDILTYSAKHRDAFDLIMATY